MSEDKGEVLLEVRRLKPDRVQIITGVLLVLIILVSLVGNFSNFARWEIFVFSGMALAIILSFFIRYFSDYSDPNIVIYSNGIEAKELVWLYDSFLFWSEIRSVNVRHYARGGSVVVLVPFDSEHYWKQARFRDVDLRDRIYHKTPLSLSIPPKYYRYYDSNVKIVYEVCQNALNSYHKKHGIKD